MLDHSIWGVSVGTPAAQHAKPGDDPTDCVQAREWATVGRRESEKGDRDQRTL